MSLKALTWAFDQKIKQPTLKLVLITLANYANEDFQTYPRQNTIAEKTGLVRETVCSSLRRLQEMGLITVARRKHETGADRSSLYTLNVPGRPSSINEDDDSDYQRRRPVDGDPMGVSSKLTPSRHDDDVGVIDDHTGCESGPQGVSPSVTGGVTDDDTFNRVLEPPLEPKQEPGRNPALKRGPAAPFPDDAFDRFWKLYPNKDGKGAVRKILRRIADEGNVEFDALMEGLKFYVNKDDFRSWAMPATWLNQERWEARPPQKRDGIAKPNRRVAI